MKCIKVFTKCQLVLLRNMNPLLGRYRLPREIIKRMDYILEEQCLGEQGFLIAILPPVRDDVREIEDAVNVYPLEAVLANDLERVELQETDCRMARNREWFQNKLCIQETNSYIYVLYSVLPKYMCKEL